MKKNVTERTFECPYCKTKQIAYKKSSRRTAENHIKHMWCWRCKEERGFIQVRY